MGRKSRYTVEEKLRAIEEYLSGKSSIPTIAGQLGIHPTSLRQWIANYESIGTEAFITPPKPYSKEIKEQAITAYLAGEGSYREICKKYKIYSVSQLKIWVRRYNGHEKWKASGKGDTRIMTKGRKTTFEERIEIASYCISHSYSYTETARKFSVSYQQARSYTVKYEKGGIDALQDKRGKRKSPNELTEIEKLRAELKMEKAKRQKAEMEASFLKKLEEIERRRG